MSRAILLIVALALAGPAAAQDAVIPQERIDGLVATLKGRGYTEVTTRVDGGVLTITATGAGGDEHFRLDPTSGELVPTDEDGITSGDAPAEDAVAEDTPATEAAPSQP